MIGLDLDGNRLVGPLLRQVDDVLGKGGGEQQGLAILLARGGAHDALDLGDKAHIQHPVRLVQHQYFHMVQVEIAATHEIQQAAGGRHHQVHHRGVQAIELLLVIHAADQGDHLQVGVPRQVNGVLGDLHHQFPGGGDNQGPGFAHEALLLNGIAQQVIENSDQEGGGLAGAGLGLADGIVALQGVGQDGGLDGGAVLEAEIGNGMHQLIAQAQVVKAGLAFLGVDREVFQAPGLAIGLILAAAATALAAPALAAAIASARGTVRMGLVGGFVSRRGTVA